MMRFVSGVLLDEGAVIVSMSKELRLIWAWGSAGA